MPISSQHLALQSLGMEREWKEWNGKEWDGMTAIFRDEAHDWGQEPLLRLL